MTTRPIRRGALAALATTLLVATPAAAHPFFEPDEVPVDSTAEVTLDVAHGCREQDDDDGGQAAAEEPTREVAIEVPTAVTFVEPADADGWDLEIERADDGTTEVVVYLAEEGTDEPAPRFDLEVVVRGDEGDEVHWRILQACDDGTHRWVGTEEDPAEEPAVTMTLAEADPDAPPPEEDETAGEQPAPDEPGVEEDATDVEGDIEGDDAEPGEQEAPEDRDGGALPGWLLIVVLVATLGVAGLVLLIRTSEDGGESGSTNA